MKTQSRRGAYGALFSVAALAAMAMSPARSAEDRSASASKGKVVATRVCAGCHDVSDDIKAPGARRPGVPPAFLTVAASPKLDAARLGEFLRFPHGEMDNLIMTSRETDDVVAYLLSLRRQ